MIKLFIQTHTPAIIHAAAGRGCARAVHAAIYVAAENNNNNNNNHNHNLREFLKMRGALPVTGRQGGP